MELYREREIRENLERQLAVELQSRSKFNKLSVTEKVNIVLEIFSVVIEIFSDIAWNCWRGHNHDKIKSHTHQVDDPQIESNNTKEVLPMLWRFWTPCQDYHLGIYKGTDNPQGIQLCMPEGFDYRTSTGLAEKETLVLGSTNKILHTPRTRGKEQWAHRLLFSHSHVQFFTTLWNAAHQASLSLTISWNLPKFMSTESVMPSNHLILCCPLLLLPSNFPTIRVFSNESTLSVRWPNYWRFSISPSKEYSGLISFNIDWFDLLALQRALKSHLQHHSLKTSILQHSAFFIVQLSYPYMTTGKTIDMTI